MSVHLQRQHLYCSFELIRTTPVADVSSNSVLATQADFRMVGIEVQQRKPKLIEGVVAVACLLPSFPARRLAATSLGRHCAARSCPRIWWKEHRGSPCLRGREAHRKQDDPSSEAAGPVLYIYASFHARLLGRGRDAGLYCSVSSRRMVTD